MQAAAFTVRGFNVEIAQIHDIITEKHTGLLRMQFWRDLLESTYKVCTHSPAENTGDGFKHTMW